MIDRRQFLATSAATMSVPLLAHPFHAVAGQTRLPFDAIICDARIAGNAAVSSAAEASGVSFASIRGDLAKLWFDSLRGGLLQRPAVVAGITSDLDAELMRAFARDVAYQQALRAEITVDADRGRKTIGQYSNAVAAEQIAMTRGFEKLIDCYMGAAMPATDQRGTTQLVAWVIAPIYS